MHVLLYVANMCIYMVKQRSRGNIVYTETRAVSFLIFTLYIFIDGRLRILLYNNNYHIITTTRPSYDLPILQLVVNRQHFVFNYKRDGVNQLLSIIVVLYRNDAHRINHKYKVSSF
jgi:hypothetical protein